jgi:predicted PurR-regulated permease PerM
MLGIEGKAARYTWTAAVVVLLLFVVFLVRKTLFVFILALLFAYLLSPLVNLLNRALPGRTRAPALGLAYVIFVGLMVVLGAQIGSRVLNQAKALAKDLPAETAKWEKPSPDLPPTLNRFRTELIARIDQQITQGSSQMLSNVAEAGVKFLTVASDLVYVVIIPILAFFFLKDGTLIREHILDLVDAGPHRALLDDLMADIHLLLAHYMRALVLLSLAAFTAYSIAFSILGVPYPVLLGAVAGILEFIPMLGPLTAALIILIVSIVAGSHTLAVLIFLVFYRAFQDYMLSPHLMGRGVELHPLLVLFGVFAGAELAGIPGTFLSVPVLALVRILYLRFRRTRLGSRLTPVSPEVS